MSGHRHVVAVLVAAFLVLCWCITAPSAKGSPAQGDPLRRDPRAAPSYIEPVVGTITDPFRPPPGPYAAGNRGIDYATVPGSAVSAASAGEVVFAGSVAGGLHVTVRHDDGLRTSYSFLASVSVRVGAMVEQGDALGTAGPLFHFGVRDAEDQYLDPALLFAGQVQVTPRLVPGTEEGAEALREHERQGFLDLAGQYAGRILPGLPGGPTSLAVLGHYAVTLQPATRALDLARDLQAWHASQDGCTAADTAVPAPEERRILVLVAGFGSTSGTAGVDAVDHATLGYASADVLRFSYAGGRIPAGGLDPDLASIPAAAYGADDSQRDLVTAADELSTLLAAVAAAEPGVPIDVVAHSQGGVVARLSTLRADASGTLPADVATLVTLSSPHGGDDLATALNGVAQPGGAPASISALQDGLGLKIDATSEATAQLSEVSPLTLDLAGRGVPDQLNFISVGARGDLVVTNPRTIVDGESSVIVDVTGVRTHDRLPGTAEATREIALARAGMGPTCSGLVDASVDALAGESISWATDAAGAAGLVLTAPLP